jgi:hypothetical protein
VTKEIITRVKLTADEGMILTDGEDYLSVVVIEEGADETLWKEITEEEYNELQEKSIAETGGE